MTYTISKDHAFSASHQLGGLPDTHPCARLHGHNYLIRVELAADTLNGTGFVVDYGELKRLWTAVDGWDHRHLNDILPFNPTAERMAHHLYDLAKSYGYPVSGVGVSETPKTWAWWRE